MYGGIERRRVISKLEISGPDWAEFCVLRERLRVLVCRMYDLNAWKFLADPEPKISYQDCEIIPIQDDM